jgi:lactoylglutathione lyase
VHIEHIALWTHDLDRFKRFYTSYLGATAAPHYVNPAKGFESCFLSFSNGARLEVMKTTSLPLATSPPETQSFGLTHLAISVGSEDAVDVLIERLKSIGVPVVDGPRRTGDGYYEAVILDPDGNRIEICAEGSTPNQRLERP